MSTGPPARPAEVSTDPARLVASAPAGPPVRTLPAPAAADVLVAARACYGWLLACTPRWILRAGAPQPPGRDTVVVTRVLGGRHLAQALVTATAGTAGVPPAITLAAGAAVDALHATSMAALALMSRPLRRAALTDATLEAGLAAAGLLAARAARAPRPSR